MTTSRGTRRIVPPYTAVGGRTSPSDIVLDQLALLRRTERPAPGHLGAAHARLLDQLAGPGIPLVEAAVNLRLPVSTVRVLTGDLIEAGAVEAHAPIVVTDQPDVHFLERVLRGLRNFRDDDALANR